jgi:hypothetical protein
VLAALAGVPAAAGVGAGGRTPEAGTDASLVDPSSVAGAYRLASGGWAVPLRAAPPDWLTPELRAEARKGPKKPPSDVEATFDVPVSGYAGIGPGSEMLFPSGCTMNFIFGSPGSYSIGTAGHCVERVGDPVTLLTVAPGGADPVGWVLVEVGFVEKRVENGVGADFALVSIKPEYQSWVRPTIPQVLGPCGAYTGDGLTDQRLPLQGHATVDAGEQIFHYGHGVGIGTGGTPRTGHALYWEAKAFWWAGTIVFGDSGSAARVGTTGLGAAGDVTHLVVNTQHLGATAAGTRIAELQRIAGKPLVSCSLCP